MAALEKIRKRAAILTIVIGAGLLAFILEEAVRASGAFRMDTMALQIGDEKIDIREFQPLVTQQQEKLQQQNPNQKTNGEELQQQVVQQLIAEKIIAQECKDASIDVTDDEILTVLCNELNIDKKTFDQIKNAKPKANPTAEDQQILQAKEYIETKLPEISNQLKSNKLGLAIMGCIKPNKLDDTIINEEQTPYDIEYTKVDYAQYANKYKVSDDEIKEAYNQYKEFFKIDQEQRRISYIKVDLDPSASDTKVANADINRIYNAFASQEGILGIKNLKTADNKPLDNLFIDSLVMKSKDNNPQFTDLLAGGVNSMIKVDPNPANPRDRNTFIYKVTKMVEVPDSLGLSYVQVMGNKQMQDSVFALLTNGVSIDSLNSTNKNQNIAIRKFDPANTPAIDGLVNEDSVRNKILAHLDGQFFLLDSLTQGGNSVAVFAQVAQHKAPVTLYSVARARYENNPSDKTIADLTKNLQNYLNKNKTAADFKKNAKAAKYEVKECVVDANNANIDMQLNPYSGQMMGGIQGTRDLIKWAFENKPGAVSEIKTDEEHGYLVVTALEDVYKDYKPFNDPTVKQQLTTYLLNKKIGEALVKECNGIKANDINTYAQKFNSTTDSITYVPGSPSVINDGKVAGRITGLAKNAVGKVIVIPGDNALYVVKVIKQGAPRPQQDNKNSFYTKMRVNPMGMLQSSRKIYNNTLKFGGQ